MFRIRVIWKIAIFLISSCTLNLKLCSYKTMILKPLRKGVKIMYKLARQMNRLGITKQLKRINIKEVSLSSQDRDLLLKINHETVFKRKRVRICKNCKSKKLRMNQNNLLKISTTIRDHPKINRKFSHLLEATLHNKMAKAPKISNRIFQRVDTKSTIKDQMFKKEEM